MSTYQLSIITPNGKVFEGGIKSLVAPGSEGSFGVMARHAPMAVSLDRGALKFSQLDSERYYAVSSGILEVDCQSNVLILLDFAVETSSLEEAKSHLINLGSD